MGDKNKDALQVLVGLPSTMCGNLHDKFADDIIHSFIHSFIHIRLMSHDRTHSMQ